MLEGQCYGDETNTDATRSSSIRPQFYLKYSFRTCHSAKSTCNKRGKSSAGTLLHAKMPRPRSISSPCSGEKISPAPKLLSLLNIFPASMKSCEVGVFFFFSSIRILLNPFILDLNYYWFYYYYRWDGYCSRRC